MVERFVDTDGGFFASAPSHLPMRARDLNDGAVPLGPAAVCELLLRLAGPYEHSGWVDIARATLERHGALMTDAPMAAPALLHAQLLAEHGADLAIRRGRAAKRCGPWRRRRSRRW